MRSEEPTLTLDELESLKKGQTVVTPSRRGVRIWRAVYKDGNLTGIQFRVKLGARDGDGGVRDERTV